MINLKNSYFSLEQYDLQYFSHDGPGGSIKFTREDENKFYNDINNGYIDDIEAVTFSPNQIYIEAILKENMIISSYCIINPSIVLFHDLYYAAKDIYLLQQMIKECLHTNNNIKNIPMNEIHKIWLMTTILGLNEKK